jgi:D-cysteine desulfhydrase family pyridoxal phosphate-dependent enzyme
LIKSRKHFTIDAEWMSALAPGEIKMAPYTVEELKGRVGWFPRIGLIHLPTPLQKMENLSRKLGGAQLYLKRDDLTGLAFGGNKSRKLEFIIPDALAKKADVIITWASLQSNWCLQTAAAARKFGLQPILVLFKTYDLPQEYDGNLLLDYIVGADIRIKEAEKGKLVRLEYALGIIEEIAREVREKGHTPYLAPVGGSMMGGSMEFPLGAISYVNAFAELCEQAESQGIKFNYVVHSTGSGGTQAGLVVGAKALKDRCRVLGISVSDQKETFSEEVFKIARETVKTLGLDLTLKKEDIFVLDEYIKEGYGIVNTEVAEVVRQVFIEEGVVLDPVYTGKAMVGLIDLIKKGYFSPEDAVVFFHTGGTPAIFPNKNKFLEFLK